jgi:hypothetical protein
VAVLLPLHSKLSPAQLEATAASTQVDRGFTFRNFERVCPRPVWGQLSEVRAEAEMPDQRIAAYEIG